MASSNGQLSTLVTLIADATKIVEAQFKQSSKPCVPSLDDTTPHPFDTQISSMELKRAIQTIEAACAQLCATVARPNHTVLNKLMGMYEPACLHVAMYFKIPDILQEKPSGMHISELGKRSGVEEGKLGRVLRLLATKHCFREVDRDVFANNRLSLQLVSSNPLTSFGLHLTDESNKATSVLAETLADPQWGSSYEPEHTPFNKWSNYPGSLFSYYEGNGIKEGAKRGARFGIGMIGWGSAIEAGAVIHDFPWNELGHGATIVDVGGGIGNVTMQLARAYPTLRLKLQDTPERIQQAQTEVWPNECPEALQEQRIEFKAMDFLTESPIKNCDIYYLKNIIHDWPDNACIKILSRVRQAMAPHSRVLIHEYILHHVNRQEGSAFDQAPEPLLSNYGVGRVRQYAIDLDMMVMLNSKERHLEELVQLGEAAGLKFVKLWEVGEMGVVEFSLRLSGKSRL